MSAITTHVLDTSLGQPGVNVRVELSSKDNGSWRPLASGNTDGDGRVSDLLPPGRPVEPGIYRLRFYLEAYFSAQGRESFYPWADVIFQPRAAGEHYHVPLLLSPFGFSTYRGS